LHTLGFENIHFCTGYSGNQFKKPDYVKSVNSKEPPRWLLKIM